MEFNFYIVFAFIVAGYAATQNWRGRGLGPIGVGVAAIAFAGLWLGYGQMVSVPLAVNSGADEVFFIWKLALWIAILCAYAGIVFFNPVFISSNAAVATVTGKWLTPRYGFYMYSELALFFKRITILWNVECSVVEDVSFEYENGTLSAQVLFFYIVTSPMPMVCFREERRFFDVRDYVRELIRQKICNFDAEIKGQTFDFSPRNNKQALHDNLEQVLENINDSCISVVITSIVNAKFAEDHKV